MAWFSATACLFFGDACVAPGFATSILTVMQCVCFFSFAPRWGVSVVFYVVQVPEGLCMGHVRAQTLRFLTRGHAQRPVGWSPLVIVRTVRERERPC